MFLIVMNTFKFSMLHIKTSFILFLSFSEVVTLRVRGQEAVILCVVGGATRVMTL